MEELTFKCVSCTCGCELKLKNSSTQVMPHGCPLSGSNCAGWKPVNYKLPAQIEGDKFGIILDHQDGRGCVSGSYDSQLGALIAAEKKHKENLDQGRSG